MQVVARLEPGEQEADIGEDLFGRGPIRQAPAEPAQILQRLGKLADETGGAVIFPIAGSGRNIEHIRRKDRIHRLVADGGGAVENHKVERIRRDRVEVALNRGEKGPFRVHVPVLGGGEFDEGRVGTGGDEVDRGPAGRLDEIGDAQAVQTHARDGGRQLALGQGGPAFRAGGSGVHAFGFANEIARHDAPDSVFLRHITEAHGVTERGLRVEIDAENAVTVERGGMGEMQRHGGFTGAALEVGDGRADGALALGAGRHERLVLDPQTPPQLVDLFESVPPLAAVLLHQALGQRRIRREAPAQGGRIDLQDQFGDFP